MDIVLCVQCPKCSAAHQASDAESPRCGVVFAKLARQAGIVEAVPVAAPGPPVGMPARAGSPVRIARGALIAGLVYWTWGFAAAPMGVAVADSVLHAEVKGHDWEYLLTQVNLPPTGPAC